MNATTQRPTTSFAPEIDAIGDVMPGLGRKILLVDDDPIQSKLVRVQLEHAGFVVYAALGARPALDTLASSQFDAILSDVVMDDINGFSFCRLVRCDPANNSLPIVLMSSYFDPEADTQLARDVGANALVQRTPSMHPCIMKLVETLADDAPTSSTLLAETAAKAAQAEARYQALVTEIAQSHRRLEVSERKYRSLIDNIPEVLWSANEDFQLTFMSANVANLCGYTAEEMISGAAGRGEDRIHPDDVHLYVNAFSAMMQGTSARVDTEYRWKHRDGRWRWFHCRAVRAIGPDGSPSIDGIFSDVTSRKLLEDQVSQAQKVEAIGQLTAGIAHDFNNILAVILTNGDYMISHLRKDSELHEVANEIQDAAKRASALSSRLLEFSRPRAVAPRPIDLNETIDGVQKILERTLGKAIRLSVVREADLRRVRADAGEIEQVLMNLAVNARDAMPNGGSLTIETRNDAENVVFSVKDTGEGMTPELREQIFQPFFTTKGNRGTGLGLSVSYGIVRRYGGQINVESERGVGTTFTISLPECSSVTPEAPSGIPSSKKQRPELQSHESGELDVLAVHRQMFELARARSS